MGRDICNKKNKLNNIYLSIKAVIHLIPYCKDGSNFFCQFTFSLINYPLKKDRGFYVIWPEPAALSISVSSSIYFSLFFQ
jgi:hypothetical protein